MYCNKVPSHRLCVTHGYEESEPGMCNYILEGTALDLRPKVVAERLEGVLHIKSWDEVSVLRMCSEKERGSIIRNVVFSLFLKRITVQSKGIFNTIILSLSFVDPHNTSLSATYYHRCARWSEDVRRERENGRWMMRVVWTYTFTKNMC